jgi:hypothetical protein
MEDIETSIKRIQRSKKGKVENGWDVKKNEQ